MNRTLIPALSCALGVAGAALWAQSPTTTPPGTTSGPTTPPSATTQYLGLVESAKLQNKRITDQQGAEIGQVQQLLLDPQSGRVRFAVIQVNQAWNFSDPEVVVPWGALQLTKQGTQDFAVTINTTRERLEKAPRFDRNRLDQLSSRQAGAPIYAYWAIIWVDDPTGQPSTGTDTRPPGSNQGPTSGGTTTTPPNESNVGVDR